MGNTLQHTCMTPTDLCTTLNHDSKYQQNIILKPHKVRSTDDIKQSILKYIETNKLQLYPIRERKVLETLVSVEQEHIADKILELDRRIKLLQNQKRELQRVKSKELMKVLKDQKQKSQHAETIQKYDEKEKEITLKMTQTKHKRKQLFQQSECLLLQDLDMIFEQIPKFDQNYQYINAILSLSGSLMAKAKQNSQHPHNQPGNQQNLINQLTKTGRQPENQSFKGQTNNQAHHTFGENIHNHRNPKKDKKNQQKIHQLLKIYDKKSLKKNPAINSFGSEVLRTNELLMIVPIECFNGVGALRDNHRTGLPSGASLLQILMNKIKAVNLRRGCNLGVVFLVNQKYTTKFTEQIQKTQGFEQHVSFQKLQITSNLSNHESDQNYQCPIPYHVIPFKNIWPSFDPDQKIVIDSVDDQIVFSTHDGDLFAFVENSVQLKTLIEKYRYVNITNVNNLLAQICDAHVLGLLEQRDELDIAVKVLRAKDQQTLLKDYFTIDDQNFFVFKESHKKSPSESMGDKKSQITAQYIPNQSYLDIGEYYIKSRIFIAQSGPLKRLLMSRISRKLDPQHQTSLIQFYLQRSISSVLYSKFTAFITVDQEYEFSHIKSSVPNLKPDVNKNGAIGYSRYCKRLLGIKENSEGKEEQEMVEIDAGILHKGSEEISRVISSLKKVKEVGFPIILYSDLFNNTKAQS